MNSGDLSPTLTKSHQTHNRDMATNFFLWVRNIVKWIMKKKIIIPLSRLSENLTSWRRLNWLSKSQFWSSLKIDGAQIHGTDFFLHPYQNLTHTNPQPHLKPWIDITHICVHWTLYDIHRWTLYDITPLNIIWHYMYI